MTFNEALSEALKRAMATNEYIYVCYDMDHPSPDWRNRYRASRYMDYAAAYPTSIRAKVAPDGSVYGRRLEVSS